MDLGITIKNERKKRQISQIDFAESCGIKQSYLSQIENNLREPNLSTLKIISSQLTIPLPILFFLSLTKDDIVPEKRNSFELIMPSINVFVSQFFVLP